MKCAAEQCRGAGLILSLLIPGAGQFVGGRKTRGVVWFLLMMVLPLAGLALLAQPQLRSPAPGIAVLVLWGVLWLCMLVDAFRPVPKPDLLEWIGYVLVGLALFVGGRSVWGILGDALPVLSNGMAPTLMARNGRTGGDMVIVQRTAYWFRQPARGDIAVFKVAPRDFGNLPAGLYLLRVAGLPGDRVGLSDGRLTINGRPVTTGWFGKARYKLAPQTSILNHPLATFLVPEGHYFLLSDNPDVLGDSRLWGPVPGESICGRVVRILWPASRSGAVE